MTTIKCPICKDRVSGATTADLNENLRMHLSDVHEMRDLKMGSRERMSGGTVTSVRSVTSERPMEREYREERIEQGGRTERMRESTGTERRGYEGYRDYPYRENLPDVGFSSPQPRIVREVETWTSRNPERFREENYIPREEVRQFMYPVTGRYGERGPTSSERLREGLRESDEDRYRRSEVGGEMATINCPLCGNLVRGRDEDDLSDELRDHMSKVHDISPKMTARFRA